MAPLDLVGPRKRGLGVRDEALGRGDSMRGPDRPAARNMGRKNIPNQVVEGLQEFGAENGYGKQLQPVWASVWVSQLISCFEL